MQSSAWIALLKHIPAEQQSRFMLVTTTGTEITIQSFLLIEQECFAVKGRLSGTQEQGRVFFVPYRNIDYFGFSQPVKDTEFTELFGNLILAAAVTPPTEPVANGQTETNPEAPTENADETSSGGSRPVIRSEVLERFRSRLSFPSPVAAAGLPDSPRSPT